MTAKPTLDHPTFRPVKERFGAKKFRATEFRGQSTLIVEPADLHEVMRFLRDDPRCLYNFLSDVSGVLDERGAILPRIDEAAARSLLGRGTISGGMIPKVRGALEACRAAGSRVRIASWKEPRVLRRLAAGEEVGTLVEAS